MPSQPTSGRIEVNAFGALLAGAAGGVDALGFITLSQIYAANMSGNTIGMALNLSKHNWLEAWGHGCPILTIIPGLIVGAAVVKIGKQARFRAALMPALLLEAAALGAFVIVGRHTITAYGIVHWHIGPLYDTLVGLLCFAMGVQNGAVRQIGALKSVHTYVTGSLLAVANGITNYIFWLVHRLRRLGKPHRVQRILRYFPRHKAVRSGSFAAVLWTMYLTGAIFGALGRLRWGINAVLVAIALLVLIAIWDVIRPIRGEDYPTIS